MSTQHFNIDDTDLKRLEDKLEDVQRKAIPFAVRNTLKDTAFMAQRFAKQDIKRDFTLRNKHTERSIIVDKSGAQRELNIDRMHAIVGSDADYMARQEFGGTQKAKGKEGKPIYTGTAANAGDKPSPIPKLPTGANRMAKIRLKGQKIKSRSKRQAFFFKAVSALQDKSKYVFIEDNNRKKGIYRIRGKLSKRGSWKIQNLEMKLIWDLSHRSTTNKPSPWLEPSSFDAVELQPTFYARRLKEQLKRQGIRTN